jgi:uncharacterized membrane protein
MHDPLPLPPGLPSRLPSGLPTRAAVRKLSLSWLLWGALVVAYLVLSAGGRRGPALAVAGLMVGVAIGAAGWRLSGALAGVALAAASMYWAESLLFIAYAPPIAAFVFMAFFFLSTLRPGVEPLITRVARREHPELPAPMARYARTLTWLWSLCFVFLTLSALLLAPILSFDRWSVWVQGLGYALPLALFLCEYPYRLHRFSGHSHGSLVVLVTNIVLVVKDAAVQPATHHSADAAGSGFARDPARR